MGTVGCHDEMFRDTCGWKSRWLLRRDVPNFTIFSTTCFTNTNQLSLAWIAKQHMETLWLTAFRTWKQCFSHYYPKISASKSVLISSTPILILIFAPGSRKKHEATVRQNCNLCDRGQGQSVESEKYRYYQNGHTPLMSMRKLIENVKWMYVPWAKFYNCL